MRTERGRERRSTNYGREKKYKVNGMKSSREREGERQK